MPAKIKNHLPKAPRQGSAQAWVIAVDMGYGHQRAAYPLRHMAYKGILNANRYVGIPAEDKKIWKESREFYETISRFKNLPLIGQAVFDLYDRLQAIPQFYPKRDLSHPNMQVRVMMAAIRKGWGKHLMRLLEQQNRDLPIVTTFPVPAFMAEYHGYPGEIYCLATDADISRAWVPESPNRSRIKYFAPNARVVERLQLYGVKSSNIYLKHLPIIWFYYRSSFFYHLLF